MIEVEIKVTVDGMTYGVEKEEYTSIGNNSKKAIGVLESQVAKIKKAIQANLPDDDRPVIEYRNVQSGTVEGKLARGAEGNVIPNPGPYS